MDDLKNIFMELAAIDNPSPEIVAQRNTLANYLSQGEFNYSIRELLDKYVDILSNDILSPEILIELQVLAIKLAFKSIHISPAGDCYVQRDNMFCPYMYGTDDAVPAEVGLGWKIIPWWLMVVTDKDMLTYHESRDTITSLPRHHIETYKKVQTIKKIIE
jgi:hypothetical protein